MWKSATIFLFAFAACRANGITPEKPEELCDLSPPYFYPCLGYPKFITPELYPECENVTTTCDYTKCYFTKAGWMDNDKVNKAKVAEYFDQYASQNKEWTPSVTYLKATCLGEEDLPPQGVPFNCAPYDILHCAQIGFVKHASPSQWKTTPECERPRAYAAACPFCPHDCYPPKNANAEGAGCKACLGLA